MEMPRPTEGHKKLEKFVGTWVGDEHMEASEWHPEPSVAQGRSVCQLALNGFAVTQDYVQTCGGQETFSGHGVYAYHPQDDVYKLYWFDSMGMGPEVFSGQWEGDVLTMVSVGPMGHMRMTADYSDPDLLASRMDLSQDGNNWKLLFRCTYSRE